MSIESVARDFVTHMVDAEKIRSLVTADAVASGGVLPQPMPLLDTLNLISNLKAAFPDIKFKVQEIMVNGNLAIVKAQWGGTNTGPVNLPVPGMPSNIPATGKKVSVQDTYILTLKGDKISRVHVESPDDGGIPAALAQLGVRMPSM
jgi:predicted ester cyclase